MQGRGAVVRAGRGLLPLGALSAVVVLVAAGSARGLWMANLHNAVLAVAFGVVGAYVSLQRPDHRLGRLFLVTGVVEAVLYHGRQVGHTGSGRAAVWWGWLGVWPVAIALALATVTVVCFPDGRPPSPRWRWALRGVVVVAVVSAGLSAGWPVEYASAGLTLDHPFTAHTPSLVHTVWAAVAHPAYVGFQLLWVVAPAARWRRADGVMRVQLGLLAAAAAASFVVLAVGLIGWGSSRPGVLAAALTPLAAGWAVVHGQHLAAYTALSWLSRSPGTQDLPDGLAAALAGALSAPSATVWVGDDELHPIGVWPVSDDRLEAIRAAELFASLDRQARLVRSGDRVLGAISVERPGSHPLSAHETRLFDDLAGQARFVIEHVGLADPAAPARVARQMERLTPREREVLELMARGLSNAAICQELHLSVKTVEPVVSAIFTKLGLPADSSSNRRVLAVLAYLDV